MSKPTPMNSPATPPTVSRRGAVTALASMPLMADGAGSEPSSAEDAVARLITLSHDSNTALMRGDITTYRALVSYGDDFTLMSPFGGTPSRAEQYTPEQWARMGRFFRNGTFTQEIVQAYGTPDMVVLALIERPHVEVGGLPAQEWALRVTLVYRRAGSDWHLVHRHADPLAHGVSHAQAAGLARGEALEVTDRGARE
jgi:ketosteroid isomerase-like protein